MDPNYFDPFDPDFPESFEVPSVVLELEVPTTSRAVDSASPPLLPSDFDSDGHPSSLPQPARTFKTPPVPAPASSPTPSSCSSTSEKRRRTYLPDPIRGTSQHQVKRQRNNVAVRKSRAKASESMQVQDELNADRRQKSELYREARSELTEMVLRFKENIFDRSPAAQAQQQALCQQLRRINEDLQAKGCEVPNLDDET